MLSPITAELINHIIELEQRLAQAQRELAEARAEHNPSTSNPANEGDGRPNKENRQ